MALQALSKAHNCPHSNIQNRLHLHNFIKIASPSLSLSLSHLHMHTFPFSINIPLSIARSSLVNNNNRIAFTPFRSLHNPRYSRGVGPMPNKKSFKPHPYGKGQKVEEAKIRKFDFSRRPINQLVNVNPDILTNPQAWLVSFDTQSRLGIIELNKNIFGADTSRVDLLHRIVTWQRACARQGTHATKTVSTVSGTNRKPHPQKGTGRARQGTLKGPHMRGGGVAHGPQPRDYSYIIPPKVKRFALRVALSVKYNEGNVTFIDQARLIGTETENEKLMEEILNRVNADVTSISKNVRALIIHGNNEMDNNLALVCKHSTKFDILPTKGVNVLMLLRATKVLITKTALAELESRLIEKSKIQYNVGSEGVWRPYRFNKKQIRAYGRRTSLVKQAVKFELAEGRTVSDEFKFTLPHGFTQTTPIFKPSPQAANPKVGDS